MRYKTDWYLRRSKQNELFIDYLINIINKHKDSDFTLTDSELRNLKYEDLGELAGACVNKHLHIVLGSNKDYHYGGDMKCVVSQARNNIKYDIRSGKSKWMNSYMISGTKDKAGDLLIVALNTITCEFEHFLIPHGKFDNSKSRIEIVIQTASLSPGDDPYFDGIYNPILTSCKWYKYKVKDFETMCLRAYSAPILLNTSLPDLDFAPLTKTDPSLQTPTPCSLALDQQQNLDFEDTLPTCLYDLS